MEKNKRENKSFEKLKETARKDSQANGLLDNADKNAETIISSFFWKEYNKDEYKIKYVTRTSQAIVKKIK